MSSPINSGQLNSDNPDIWGVDAEVLPEDDFSFFVNFFEIYWQKEVDVGSTHLKLD